MDGFVKRLKYDKQLEFARTLGELFAARWMGQSTPQPELIVPVPLHRVRLRERGFNQSLEIAREVGKRPELRIDYQSVIRVKPTPPQTDLPLKKRRSNVRNAFKVIKPIEAQHVAILDDVMTTGSTADELARCLKQSGVERIDVWTVTRASNQINQYSCC
ncbi:MAG: ComF family protein [Gammaproteobacteria bacterium]|nr:ComF family protein [Gammaproteobacteria bacterium]